MPLKESMRMFDELDLQTYFDSVAFIESGGEEDPYAAIGGANNHYDGKYQMSYLAKQDAARILGFGEDTKKHPLWAQNTPAGRAAFRADPAIQEKAIRAYTKANHGYMKSKTKGDTNKYTDLSPQEQLSVLGYAHNQGAGGASKWMRSGYTKSEKDAFGTSGTKYSDAVARNLTESAQVAQQKKPVTEQKIETEIVPEETNSFYDMAMSLFSNQGGDFDEIGPNRFAYQIAKDNNLTLEQLQALNPDQEITRGSQGTEMKVGQQLRVKELSDDSSSVTPTKDFDTVGQNRFAGHIAYENGMTLDELQELNPEVEITRGAMGRNLQDGQQLRVGKGWFEDFKNIFV